MRTLGRTAGGAGGAGGARCAAGELKCRDGGGGFVGLLFLRCRFVALLQLLFWKLQLLLLLDESIRAKNIPGHTGQLFTAWSLAQAQSGAIKAIIFIKRFIFLGATFLFG